MLSWPGALCERLAAGGRRVVRYDLRDSGESTTANPEAPGHPARPRRRRGGPCRRARRRARAPRGDRRRWNGRPGCRARPSPRVLGAHPGRHPWCARQAGRRPPRSRHGDDGAPVPRPMPDWTDRESVAEFAAAGAESSAMTPSRLARSRRASGTAHPGPHPRSRWPTSSASSSPRSTANPAGERLLEIEVPTLVVHGRRDLFFPVGNGEAIAREIPGARLLVLDEAATAPRCGGRRGRRGDARARVADRQSARLLSA